MALLARECARAEFQDWEKKEEEFHFDQSKVRSEIRLREGRTKPIDVLSKHINPPDDLDIEVNEPYMVFKGLTVKEMEELHEDIKMHLEQIYQFRDILSKEEFSNLFYLVWKNMAQELFLSRLSSCMETCSPTAEHQECNSK